MNLFSNFQNTISELEKILEELEKEFPAPRQVTYGNSFRYRYAPSEKSDILASFLKSVRIISLLNASMVLMENGYIQEIYILGRAIDEASEDIHFLGMQIGETGTSKNQQTLLRDFYQELLTDPDDPLSISKSQAVQRRQIQEALGDAHGSSGADRVKLVARSIYRIFSGFAHGSFPAIMELYGSKFHFRGMLNTPRIEECVENFSNYIYRAILSLMIVASRLGRKDLLELLENIRIRFVDDTSCVGQVSL